MTTATPRAMAAGYDAFLSYNWRDHEVVEQVASSLQKRDLRVFLDRWYLPAGIPWVSILEESIGSCRAVVVFVGAHGLGNWQQRESNLALTRQARDGTFPVIPVLLPGAEPPLGFLSQNTWLRFPSRPDDDTFRETLAAAILGGELPREVQERLLAALASICPFRGLRPFREEDAPFFFGREQFVLKLQEVVALHPFTAVVGSSGSGKSSVVQAGLLPVLRQARDRVWDTVTMRPGDRPLHALARAFLPLIEPDLKGMNQLERTSALADDFANRRISLRDVVTHALELQPGTDRILLVVDQWEELYTPGSEKTARERFVGELLESVNGSLSVVMTLRGDFFGQTLGHRALADRIQDAQVNLGPMTSEEVTHAIEKPAEKVGLELEDGLAERIMDDVRGEPGNLPLLEFVLTELWEARDHGRLLHEAYRVLGGAEGAIAKRADDAFEQLGDRERELARRTWLRLVYIGGVGMVATRRRATFAELGDEARPIVQRFTDARLLVTAGNDGSRAAAQHADASQVEGPHRDVSLAESDEEQTVEVAHEALIRKWKRFVEWIDRDREFLLWRQRLGGALDIWQQDGSGTLLTDSRLVEARRWQGERGADLAAIENRFINESRTAFERARRRRALAIVGLIALLALVAWLVNWGRLRAVEAAARSRAAALVASASLVKDSDPTTAALLIGELAPVSGSSGTLALAHDVASHPIATAVLRGHTLALRDAAVSPDGTRVVTASDDDTARVWWLDGHASPVVLQGHEGPVLAVAFSRDGKHVVTASADGTAKVWWADGTGQPVILRGHEGAVRDAAFSPDGTRVVTASADGTASVWPSGGGEPLILSGHKGAVSSAAFSPDGGQVMTASDDGTVQLWRADGGGEPVVLGGHEGGVTKAAFSADGRRVVVGAKDGTARVWDIDGGGEPIVLSGHAGVVRSVGFSPDGTRVVTASDDDTARVWQADGSGEPIVLVGYPTSSVRQATFSPDGTRILTVSDDYTARIWPADHLDKPVVFRGHKGSVVVAAFTPDGTRLVTASEDATARIWPAAGSSEPSVLRGHTKGIRSIAFSPDGSKVVTASEDGSARVWPVYGGEPVVLPGHAGAVLGAAFSPDGTHVITASADGAARVWPMKGSRDPVVLLGHKGAVYSGAFSPDGNRVVTASADGTARVWRAEDDAEPLVLEHAGPVRSAWFIADGKKVVTASWDGTVRVWRADRTDAEVVLPVPKLLSASLSRDGTRVVTTSEDNVAQVWLLDGSGKPAVLAGQGGRLWSAVLSPDATRVVTAWSDHTAQVWRVDGSAEPVLLRGHTGAVQQAEFSADGMQVMTASRDGTARVWAADGRGEPEVLDGNAGSLLSAALSPDGKRVVTAYPDGTARIWRVGWELLAAYLRSSTRDCLSVSDRRDLLGESAADAKEAYTACEQRAGADPRSASEVP